MNDTAIDMRLRAEAAKALMPYMHRKVGELGKRAAAAAAGAKAGAGKYAPSPPPLRAVK
jgi:phage terminase small subunit